MDATAPARCGQHAWQSLHPPLQCHREGWLEVGDDHEIFWEESGHPLGRPVLFVHGGPGAGCTPDDRRWFDPRRHRIVLFDQRGAGRSRPSGRLHANTTEHLVADIEALRRHLQVDRWSLFGGSWGATLALAYAQRHPGRVTGLVLRGVFLARGSEQRWLYAADGAARLRPMAWKRLQDAVGGAADVERGVGGMVGIGYPDRGSDGLEADWLHRLAHRLQDAEPDEQRSLAHAWLDWEDDLIDPDASFARRRLGDEVAMARIGVHFARHSHFLYEAQLLVDAHRLQGVPGVIVQGELDLVTPPPAARALHHAWPGSRYEPVDRAGHASSHPEMARRLIDATDGWSA